MSLIYWLQLLPIATLAGISTLAVFSPEFRDNLFQRIGLSMISIGACLQIIEVYHQTGTHAPMLMIVYGGSAYALGTFCKIAHQHYREQRHAAKH